MTEVIVVGAGHWGPNLIRNFHNHQTSIVSCVVDQDPDKLERVRTRFPGVATSRALEQALVAHPAEAVVVATPTTTHYELARTALEAGRNVLVEKPITTSAQQGRQLCALARQRCLVLMVGHVFVYNAAIQKVRDYLREDLLGPLHYISMVRTNLGPIRTDVNAAWDLASHDLAIVDYWLGARPESVAAAGNDWINRGVEDAVFATLWYPGGIMVNLHVSWLNPRKVRDNRTKYRIPCRTE